MHQMCVRATWIFKWLGQRPIRQGAGYRSPLARRVFTLRNRHRRSGRGFSLLPKFRIDFCRECTDEAAGKFTGWLPAAAAAAY